MSLSSFKVETRSHVDVIFPLRKYGDIGPGVDITEALNEEWNDTCASFRPSAVIIPRGIFKVSEVKFKGPCKSPIEIRLRGTLQAPKHPQGDSWITFAYVDRLTLSGEGVFYGKGKAGWEKNDCHKNINCADLPISSRFNFITNSIVKRITSLDSKNFHINILGCNNLTFHGVNIIAPENSLNTDGIHIGRSIGISIIKSRIATGDGSKRVKVTNVTCGPGHGISIGSLGKYTNEEPVEGVVVKNCTIMNTTNGVRIKTWPASPVAGTATNMHFSDIIMVNVSIPILIDQEYCPWNQCNRKIPSKIKISKVSFKNIIGTSATPMAVKLVCSSDLPCDEVKITNIDLVYNGKEGPITSQCRNVRPIILGIQNPQTCSSPYVFP
ncbi:exopolygalacturonase-like [Benincasa hispida]|uniref:exopolygalacturonase-like n=1 Tax=Benincasa hispida TaxID=102211 RepID=UPI0019027A7F|nr:exopolygalacturonase-like [Benincasa hispida]